MIGIIIAIIAGLLVLLVIGSYNLLVSSRNRVKNGWHQIDVQLKRRIDLIPNLVETVKAYAAHEREVLEKIAEARTQAINARGPGEAPALTAS